MSRIDGCMSSEPLAITLGSEPSRVMPLQPVREGTHVVVDEGGGRLRLWATPAVVLDTVTAPDQVYVLEADVKEGRLDVFRLERRPLSGVPTGFPDWLVPLVRRADGSLGTATAHACGAIALVTAALAIQARLLADPVVGTVRPDVGAGEGLAFSTEAGFLLATEALGLVSVREGGEPSQGYEPLKAIARVLTRQVDLLPDPIGGSVRESVGRTLTALAAAEALLDGGGMLRSERHGGNLFLRVAGRTLVLRPWQIEDPATLIENPQSYCDDDRWTLVDALPLAPMQVPGSLLNALPAVEVRLGRDRQAVIDDMVARLREGGTVSGGPTTDQRWRLSFSTTHGAPGGFRIAGTNPDGVRTDDPLTEAEVREMLAYLH